MATTLLNRLHEERATAYAAFQEIQARRAAAGYDPTAEDGEALTRSLDDVERLSAEIEREEKAAEVEARMSALEPAHPAATPAPVDEREKKEAAYNAAFDTYIRSGMDALNGQQRDLLQAQLRAQGTTPDSAGGYLVPASFRAKLVEAVKSYGGLLGLAEVLTTAKGETIKWPTNDDTDNEGEIVGENQQIAETDLTFGTMDIGSFIYTSRIVRISRALLQDSSLSMDNLVARKLGERIGRRAARDFATGDRVGKPEGIIAATNSIVTAAAKIGYDDLVNLEHAVDHHFRSSAQYLIHDSALRDLRKLKDNEGRPLWVPAITDAAPSLINGKPYTVDNSLPEWAPGSKSVVYGDFKASYLIRQAHDVETLRANERYIDFLQVGFLAFMRMDARIQNQQAIATLTAKA